MTKNIYEIPCKALENRGRRNVLLQRSFTSDLMTKINLKSDKSN
jgi:hypothetical protein